MTTSRARLPHGHTLDGLAMTVALLAHAGLVVFVRPREAHVVPEPPELVVFELDAPPPRPVLEAPPVPTPTPTPTPDPAPRTPRIDRRVTPPSSPTTPVANAPAEPPPGPAPSAGPVDLAGVVLSTGGAGTFVLGPGSGGGAQPHGSARPEGVEAAAVGPRIARSAADLREDVRPPAGLDALLEARYPSAARGRGITGLARVRLRIDATGRVASVSLVSETPVGEGFGEACRRALLAGPAWSPARDPDGEPITRVGRDFTCRFELR